MKKNNGKFAIRCTLLCGPSFYGNDNFEVLIEDRCNRKNCCLINNNGENGYECHPVYKKSLFVNTNQPDNDNLFTVEDYEVFSMG